MTGCVKDNQTNSTENVELKVNVAPSMPRLGEKAPQFEAKTTDGMKSLNDYEGKWLILFSHPADFTPVCTTEFMAFQDIKPELDKRGVDLIGLSIDSVHSHIAWLRTIEEKFGKKIEFPVIDDVSMKVATAYGMVQPGESTTAASRCVFIIDDKQIIRAMIYYPLSAGRNMDEILRLVDSLQTTDKHGVATPANWRVGEKVIVPPANTSKLAEERMNDTSIECTDWFFCKKNI